MIAALQRVMLRRTRYVCASAHDLRALCRKKRARCERDYYIYSLCCCRRLCRDARDDAMLATRHTMLRRHTLREIAAGARSDGVADAIAAKRALQERVIALLFERDGTRMICRYAAARAFARCLLRAAATPACARAALRSHRCAKIVFTPCAGDGLYRHVKKSEARC